jgi:hypothetical protein
VAIAGKLSSSQRRDWESSAERLFSSRRRAGHRVGGEIDGRRLRDWCEDN